MRRLCRHNFWNNWTAHTLSINRIIGGITGKKRTTCARVVHVCVCVQYFSYGGAGFTHVSCAMKRSGSSLSKSDSTQVSDLATGNTGTGSESGVQSLLDWLKAPQRSELAWKQ